MQINPYLLFNGQSEAAMRFYEKCLGGKITMTLRYGESLPPPTHLLNLPSKSSTPLLTVGDSQLQASDCPPDKCEKPQGFSVTLQESDLAKAESVFNALAEAGDITMPFGKASWAKGFGMATDKFGVPWMVNCG
jgi:PhnB protein